MEMWINSKINFLISDDYIFQESFCHEQCEACLKRPLSSVFKPPLAEEYFSYSIEWSMYTGAGFTTGVRYGYKPADGASSQVDREWQRSFTVWNVTYATVGNQAWCLAAIESNDAIKSLPCAIISHIWSAKANRLMERDAGVHACTRMRMQCRIFLSTSYCTGYINIHHYTFSFNIFYHFYLSTQIPVIHIQIIFMCPGGTLMGILCAGRRFYVPKSRLKHG